ncbi:MAG TPA: YgjP-like metallopeptidase domain-containing protein [Rhodocyclaceae bacterium]
MKPRDQQLALRLDDSTPDPDAAWRDHAHLPYLGASLTLRLDTQLKTAERLGTELHLPLPPEATPRQIRDATEAWLRGQAKLLLTELIAGQAAALGVRPPKLALSFAARSNWAQAEGNTLRCNWRLIEQPARVVEQVVGRAVASIGLAVAESDLFGGGDNFACV